MFKDLFDTYNWDEVKHSIYAKTSRDVEQALSRDKRNLEDFKALISPAAEPYLEQMAQISHQLTQKRFGKTIQMYIPMYLSNECQNICTYCGFSFTNKIPRKTLSDEEIIKEFSDEVVSLFLMDKNKESDDQYHQLIALLKDCATFTPEAQSLIT